MSEAEFIIGMLYFDGMTLLDTVGQRICSAECPRRELSGSLATRTW
ncbi:hypothetical protein ACIBCN_26535 [Nocardia sp. NPDC051052]